MRLLLFGCLVSLSVVQAAVCSVYLVNQTRKYLVVTFSFESRSTDGLNGEATQYELRPNEAETMLYKCNDEDGYARTHFTEYVNGQLIKLPFGQPVFANNKYYVRESKLRKISLRFVSTFQKNTGLEVLENKISGLEKLYEVHQKMINDHETSIRRMVASESQLNELKQGYEFVSGFLKSFNAECGTTASKSGDFKCRCKAGFTLDNGVCVDLDECKDKNSCPSNAVCKNTIGSYSCSPYAVLAINERTDKKAELFDGNGKAKSVNFQWDTHVVYLSCSVKFKNEVFVIGGTNSNKRRISKVLGCGMRSVGELSFDLDSGACVATEEMLILCFDWAHKKICRTATSIDGKFTEINDSFFDHGKIRSAVSKKIMLAAGSRSPDHSKTEILNLQNLKWKVTETYPFHKSINHVPMIYHDSHFYTFGSWANGSFSTVAAFSEIKETWSKVGDLSSARNGHAAIAYSNYYLVIGGYGNQPTEKCKLSGNKMVCTPTGDRFTDFVYFPEVFLVPEETCF